MSRIAAFPWYVVLLAAYPVLFNTLFAAGLSQWPDRFWYARNSVPLILPGGREAVVENG